MPKFERYLTVWGALCSVAGLALRYFLPEVFQTTGSGELAKINLSVAVFIWLMIISKLAKIDFAGLGQVCKH